MRNSTRVFALALLTFTVLTATSRASEVERQKAWAIAAESLRKNTIRIKDRELPDGRYCLVAGGHQFRDIWIRDLSMSVGGMLALGQNRVVRDSLELVFQAQRADGTLPRVLDNMSVTTRTMVGALGVALRFKAPLKGYFETENNVLVIDGNVAIPWAAWRYIAATGDREFAARWYDGMARAIEFLETHYFVEGLIGNQPPYADWEDSVARRGRVAFTNIYYILALRSAAEWSAFLGHFDRALFYTASAARATQSFHDYFWDNERKMVRNFEGDDHLTADANLMAVAHHILSPAESEAAMRTLRASPLWQPMPGRATWPDFPRSMKDTIVKLVGLADYHDSLYWIWLTAQAAIAERELGNCAGYQAVLDTVSHKLAKDGELNEVYQLKKHGRLKRVRRILYRAENPFTWSSAMFIEAMSLGCR